MPNTMLEFKGISKAYFGIYAVRDVSLSIEQGHVLGLIGQNGAGKSTLMNILGGVVRPDSGEMLIKGKPHRPRSPLDAMRAGIAFIHQELNLFTNLSIAENIYIDSFPRLGKGRWPILDRGALRQRTGELLKSIGLEPSPNVLVERLSPGERQMVEIAKALSIDAEIIIFDEPTTSLTPRETDHLFALIRQLREQNKTMIYISHILGDVMDIADDIAVLRDGELIGSGPKDEFSINRMISMMVGRNIEQLHPPRTSTPEDDVVLEARNISQSGIVEAINFSLRKGEVLGLFGLMASGRTELARILFGLDEFQEGQVLVNNADLKRVTVGSSIENRIAFVTENRREEGLLMDISIAENISLVSLPQFCHSIARFVRYDDMIAAASQVVSALQIKSGPIHRHPAKSLSGGNQQKTVIAKWLMSRPLIFIMDEPTRGVDVGAKYEIYSIINELAAQGSGILFISSELEELMAMCDRILVMSRGEMRGEFARADFDEEQILRTAFRQENGA